MIRNKEVTKVRTTCLTDYTAVCAGSNYSELIKGNVPLNTDTGALLSQQTSLMMTTYGVSLPLASRNSAKSADLGNIAPSGIGGPKGGTSFERDTARLKIKKIVFD